MLQPDLPIWYDFLDKYGNDFLRFYYDVALTTKPKPPEAPTQALVTFFIRSWGKRIDAVGETEKNVWIIEVTEHAFLRALGQIMLYTELWRIDPPIKKPFTPNLVTRIIDEDVAHVCNVYGINYFLV